MEHYPSKIQRFAPEAEGLSCWCTVGRCEGCCEVRWLLCIAPWPDPLPPAYPGWYQQWRGGFQLIVQDWLHEVFTTALAGVSCALVAANRIIGVNGTLT
jgi:hypothetical protein